MKLRFLGTALAAAVTIVLAPAVGLVAAPTANAAGDVCDICSVNFDLRLCEELGGYPYDSTLEDPPAAISNPQPQPQQPEQPAPPQQPSPPQQPAPQPPTQPQQQPNTPQQPASQQQPNTSQRSATQQPSTSEATSGTPGQGVIATAVAPAAPSALAGDVAGRTATFTWQVPADGGSPLTAYKLILNGGTPIEIPAGATSYEIELGAGTYDVVLLATNAVGDSAPSETLSGVAVEVSPTPTPSETAELAALTAQPASTSTPLVGGLVLGALVLGAGGLLAWWWLRRRAAPTAS